MDALKQIIEEFLKYEFADEVLIALGLFLVVVAILKIIRSSLRLVIWVLLAMVGVASVSYGMDRSSVTMPGGIGDNLRDLVIPGTELTTETLWKLCQKIGDKATE